MSRRDADPPKERPANAVALRYDGNGAPRVVAKGRGELAARIREVAREHDVPLHEDDDLVELLSSVDLGEEIPAALYVAVAHVLAFAYRISGRVPDSPRRAR